MMGFLFWLAIWKVRLGLRASFRAFGRSMEPVVPSGSVVTIEPVDAERLVLGDIVAVRVGHATMLHLVKAIDRPGRRVEISGTSGSANGWTGLQYVYGVCTRIDGKVVPGAQAKPGLFSRLFHSDAHA